MIEKLYDPTFKIQSETAEKPMSRAYIRDDLGEGIYNVLFNGQTFQAHLAGDTEIKIDEPCSFIWLGDSDIWVIPASLGYPSRWKRRLGDIAEFAPASAWLLYILRDNPKRLTYRSGIVVGYSEDKLTVNCWDGEIRTLPVENAGVPTSPEGFEVGEKALCYQIVEGNWVVIGKEAIRVLDLGENNLPYGLTLTKTSFEDFINVGTRPFAFQINSKLKILKKISSPTYEFYLTKVYFFEDLILMYGRGPGNTPAAWFSQDCGISWVNYQAYGIHMNLDHEFFVFMQDPNSYFHIAKVKIPEEMIIWTTIIEPPDRDISAIRFCHPHPVFEDDTMIEWELLETAPTIYSRKIYPSGKLFDTIVWPTGYQPINSSDGDLNLWTTERRIFEAGKGFLTGGESYSYNRDYIIVGKGIKLNDGSINIRGSDGYYWKFKDGIFTQITFPPKFVAHQMICCNIDSEGNCYYGTFNPENTHGYIIKFPASMNF